MRGFTRIALLAAAALCALAAFSGVASAATVDRGLPTANLNNAAGADRSNVAWSDGSGDVTGDTFTVGTTGHEYALDSLTVWNIGHFGSPFSAQFSDVTLYLAGSDGSLQVIPATFSATPVEYADNTNYQATSGSFRQLFQDTFSNLNVTLDGGTTYYFAVDGTSLTEYDWFNHASNADLSGSPQDGADGVYYAWDKTDLSTPHACDSSAPTDDSFCDGGWDKSSDINVSIDSHEIITAATLIDRDGACASTPVWRTDGTQGIFVDLDQASLAQGTTQGITFTPAFFVAGYGETCNPPAGFHAAGYSVDSDGTVDQAAPQFDTHPLYVAN